MSDRLHVLRVCCLVPTILVSAAALTTPAHAACGDKDRVQCRDEFEAMSAVVATASGFTVAGQVRKGPSLAPALLRIARDGKDPRVISLPWPGNPQAGRTVVAEPRKLIALPAGGFFVIGQLTYPDDQTTSGWAMRLAENGQVLWNVPIEDTAGSVVVHSAIYDAKQDNLIVVGRLTSGSDEGRCENWSQSFVFTLRAMDGAGSVPKAAFGEPARGPNNRQAIYDIIPGDAPGSFLAAGFTTVPNSRTPAKCQDNILVGRLLLQSGKWEFTPLGRVGAKDTNEVAFAIRPIGPGTYLLAGHHRDGPDAAAATAYAVRIAPLAVAGMLSTPFPPDGSDKTGGDRFRMIVPLPERGRYLLAGSASASAQASNRALWQIVPADLKRPDAPVVFAAPSDIADAAISSDGRILAVGRLTDEDGRRLGFTGFIGEAPILLGHRPPDSRLPDVTTLPLSEGAYGLPAAALANGAGYFGRNLAAGSQTDIAFTVPAARTVKISTLTDAGDIDLVLTDRAKRPLAFSNFKSSATEVLIATLPPGSYTLSLVAQTAVPAYELRFAPSQEMGSKVLSDLQQLSEGQRVELTEALRAAGYTASSEPTIALGAETARALLAAQEGAPQPVGPRGIGRTIAQSVGGK